MAALWKDINLPVIIMHGTKDTLVPVENVDFMKKRRSSKALFLVIKSEGGTHFLPWENFVEVQTALLRLENT